jgi:VWFA-related protein
MASTLPSAAGLRLVAGLLFTGALALAATPLAGRQSSQPAPKGQTGSQAPSTPPAQQPPAASGQATPPGEAQPAPEQPVFRTGINFVRVDVIVSDKQGNPVTDLKLEDFDVTEEGKPQKVETFKLIKLDGQPEPGEERPRAIRTTFDEETEAQREDTRIFVFFLDDYHVRRGGAMGVREPLIRFIRNNLGPMDMLAVMYPLTPVTGLAFTRNHEAVVREIERFEGRKGDYRPRNQFEEQYSMYPVEVVERIRNQVSLSAMKGLTIRLGGLREGRKAVIVVSEGYSNYVPPQLRDPIAEMPGIGNPARGRPMVGEGSMGEDRRRFFDSAEMISDLREVFNNANRNNTALYTLDPRGLAVFEYDINESVGLQTDRQVLQVTQDTLRILADETDGRAIVNRNDLDGGLKQVVRDSSAYYLIGYNSTEAPADGKFHQIKVRVKRPGVQVRARKGYWALTAEETARALAPPKPPVERGVTDALASVQAPNRARLVRTWIGTAPAESGRTRVTFVWEPVPTLPGERRTDAPSRVALMAAGAEGRAYYRGKVPDDDAGTGEGVRMIAPAAASTARGAAVEFEAQPGKMQLRLSVEGASGQVIDSDMLDVAVPDYTAPQVAVTSLEVLRARTVPEFRELSANATPMPVAEREFRRTERLLIRFAAHAPGGAAPETTVRLLNRGGQKMSDLTAQPLAIDPRRLQVDLPLASLPAGEYVVEVKATAGESEAKQFVGFKVVS